MLDSLYEVCDMYLYTAANCDYADLILKSIDPSNKYFHGRWYKQHCTRFTDKYIKDLSTTGLPLPRTILVDNCAYSYAYHILNGVPITSYDRPDHNDTELMALKDFILHLRSHADVRTYLAGYFKQLTMHSICDNLADAYTKIFSKE